MNELAENNLINIENMIYEIDGKEVMLDSDLAKLYNVETKRINEAVKNNPEKFPNRFSWILTLEETKNISRSKISTLNNKQGSNIKYSARVFTEQGVYMLATILKSKEAIKTTIRIMDTFVNMRHYINFNKNILPYKFLLLEEKVDINTKRIDEFFDKFDSKDIIKKCIIYKGEIYDAHSILLDILYLTKKEIIIIDNYISKELLDILKDINKKVIIISSNPDPVLTNKYIKQYHNITFIKNDSYHDRFIIIDRKRLFHCGASFKDLGKRCFAITEFKDTFLFEEFLDKLIELIV